MIYPVDSVIHLSNNPGLTYTLSASMNYLVTNDIALLLILMLLYFWQNEFSKLKDTLM